MLRRFAFLALSLALLSAPVGPSFAQTAPDDDPDEMDEPAQPQGREREARGGGRDRGDRGAIREAVRRRAATCRREAARQNLRGSEARDSAIVCLAEARLACLKRAVEARVARGPERQDYINKCLGET